MLAPFFSEAPVRPGLLLGFGAIELLDIDPALDGCAIPCNASVDRCGLAHYRQAGRWPPHSHAG
jgi:hypothetical protein